MEKESDQVSLVWLRDASDTFVSLCYPGYKFLGKILKALGDLPDLQFEENPIYL
jgi:hypothetical protein